MKLSNKFIKAVRLHKTPKWNLAVTVGLRPDQFSKYLSGWYDPRGSNADKLIAMASLLNLKPNDVFTRR